MSERVYLHVSLPAFKFELKKKRLMWSTTKQFISTQKIAHSLWERSWAINILDNLATLGEMLAVLARSLFFLNLDWILATSQQFR